MKMTVLRCLGTLGLVAVAASLGTARADLAGIGGPNNVNYLGAPGWCTSCQGSWYQLHAVTRPDTPGDTQHENYRITLTIDTSTYSGLAQFIDSVAIKVSNTVVSGSLWDAPGGLSNWALAGGGVNAGGCSGSGGGFECADYIGNVGKGAPVGGTLSWTFDVLLNNGTLFVAPGQASIKARYVDFSGLKVGSLVSTHISLIKTPEPGTWLMLATALGGILWGSRKKYTGR